MSQAYEWTFMATVYVVGANSVNPCLAELNVEGADLPDPATAGRAKRLPFQ
jgi:hypothetical protein